jgi:hypothetical protein
MRATWGVKYRPSAVPMVHWPRLRSTFQLTVGAPVMEHRAVASSGPIIQGSGCAAPYTAVRRPRPGPGSAPRGSQNSVGAWKVGGAKKQPRRRACMPRHAARGGESNKAPSITGLCAAANFPPDCSLAPAPWYKPLSKPKYTRSLPCRMCIRADPARRGSAPAPRRHFTPHGLLARRVHQLPGRGVDLPFLVPDVVGIQTRKALQQRLVRRRKACCTPPARACSGTRAWAQQAAMATWSRCSWRTTAWVPASVPGCSKGGKMCSSSSSWCRGAATSK